ncbi:hypothetical protein BJF78_07670 [Pseudonocardia sp. CNS-139]|nr:hypothetical protein BJF78_07670 [Pseudonocardia sp. CNS-139]
MTPVRWWSEMTRGLAGPVPAAAPPPGLELSPLGPGYDAARWDAPLLAAHNAAFADHWGSTPTTAASWTHFRTGRAFRPACSVAALAPDGTVAGYVMAYEFEADTAASGVRDLHVGTVGTLRAHRRRGVAAAMLAHVLRTGAGLGYGTSSLTVDAQNPTGALGVYERAGYRLHRREVTYRF